MRIISTEIEVTNAGTYLDSDPVDELLDRTTLALGRRADGISEGTYRITIEKVEG